MSHSHLAWSTCGKILGCFHRWLLKASCRPRTSKDLPLSRSGNHFLNSATMVSSGICFSQEATMIRKLLIQLPAPKLCLAGTFHTHKTNALHLTTSTPTKLQPKQRHLPHFHLLNLRNLHQFRKLKEIQNCDCEGVSTM